MKEVNYKVFLTIAVDYSINVMFNILVHILAAKESSPIVRRMGNLLFSTPMDISEVISSSWNDNNSCNIWVCDRVWMYKVDRALWKDNSLLCQQHCLVPNQALEGTLFFSYGRLWHVPFLVANSSPIA